MLSTKMTVKHHHHHHRRRHYVIDIALLLRCHYVTATLLKYVVVT